MLFCCQIKESESSEGEDIMGYMQNQQEIHEAICAADDALEALRRADRSLSSASS